MHILPLGILKYLLCKIIAAKPRRPVLAMPLFFTFILAFSPNLVYNIFMFRLWGKIYKNNKLAGSITIEDASVSRTRTQKVFSAVEEICRKFDLGQPIWLDSNISSFKRLSRTRFSKDNFIESIDFDFLEIQIIEED